MSVDEGWGLTLEQGSNLESGLWEITYPITSSKLGIRSVKTKTYLVKSDDELALSKFTRLTRYRINAFWKINYVED